MQELKYFEHCYACLILDLYFRNESTHAEERLGDSIRVFLAPGSI